MKKLLLTFGITLLLAGALLAQAPQAFKYQAIARDTEGNVISDRQVSLRISLLQGSESGQAVYSETHKLQTSRFGLITLEIGNGNNKTGDFSGINWGISKYFINIEIDPSGGTDYKIMGVSPLLSVPYALYAEKSGDNNKEAMSWTEGSGLTYLTNTNNYVGIGLNNPSARLHIDTKTGNLNSGIKLFLSLENSNSKYRYTGIDFFSYTSGLTGQLLISGNSYNNPIVNLPTNSFGFFTQNTNGSLVFHATGSGGDIRMGTGGYGISNERLRIDVAGNVGIGLTNPSYKLDVAGDVNISAGSNYKVDGVDMVSSPWIKSPVSSDIYYTAGNVAVGTTSPARAFEVYDTDWKTARISSSSSGATVEFVSSDDDWLVGTWAGDLWLSYSDNDFATQTDQFLFTTDAFFPFTHNTKTIGTTYKRFSNIYNINGDFSGKVGIGLGSSSPSHPLHVEVNTGTFGSTAIFGENLSTGTGQQLWGVFGQINTTGSSNSGAGVIGYSAATTGTGTGIRGESASADGRGVYARTSHSTGTNYAIYASTASSNGYAGYFDGGRNYFEGNVGIGTTSPGYPLHVRTSSGNYAVYVDNDYAGSSSKIGLYSSISSDGTGTRYGSYNYVYANSSDASSSYGGYFYVSSNSSPGDVYGVYGSASSSGTGTNYGVYGYAYEGYGVYGSASGGWAGYFPYGDTYIGGDLRVGWTTDVPGYIAAIDGKVICEEVRVALSGDWPDYVFNDEYDLMPINELEKNVKKNKHLPGIPSAKEIENGGIMLGDMTQNLTKKVEELTLYIIELNNQNKLLNKRIEKLEQENILLKNK